MAARRWVLAGALALGGCARSGGDMADLQPPPGFTPPPVRPLRKAPLRADRLGFGLGFWPAEHDESKTWYWMGARGEVRLAPREQTGDGGARAAGPHRLRIVGRVLRDRMPRAPTLRITLGGHLLASFEPADAAVDWAMTVGADVARAAASAPLVIETDTTVRVPGDPRDLGLAIDALDWQPLSR